MSKMGDNLGGFRNQEVKKIEMLQSFRKLSSVFSRRRPGFKSPWGRPFSEQGPEGSLSLDLEAAAFGRLERRDREMPVDQGLDHTPGFLLIPRQRGRQIL